MTLMKTTTTRPMTLTATNLFALRSVFGAAVRVSNRIDRTAATHLRRAIAMNLVVVDGAELALTVAGIAAVSK